MDLNNGRLLHITSYLGVVIRMLTSYSMPSTPRLPSASRPQLPVQQQAVARLELPQQKVRAGALPPATDAARAQASPRQRPMQEQRLAPAWLPSQLWCHSAYLELSLPHPLPHLHLLTLVFHWPEGDSLHWVPESILG
jgi:hypothetical protein